MIQETTSWTFIQPNAPVSTSIGLEMRYINFMSNEHTGWWLRVRLLHPSDRDSWDRTDSRVPNTAGRDLREEHQVQSQLQGQHCSNVSVVKLFPATSERQLLPISGGLLSYLRCAPRQGDLQRPAWLPLARKPEVGCRFHFQGGPKVGLLANLCPNTNQKISFTPKLW